MQFDLKLKLGSSAHVCLRSSLGTLCTRRLSKNKLYLKRKQEKQTNETHCTFLLRLRHVVHIVMYNLKATLYVTVCLAGFVTKTYGEQKSWPDFAFRSSVNRKRHHAPQKNNKSVFESDQTHYGSSEKCFSKKLSDMTLVSMSVSNFVNMRGVNFLDFSVSFKHTVLPFFASFGRSLRELLPRE